MNYFRQVMSGVNPEPLLAQITQHLELWGASCTWTEGKPDSVLTRMGMAENNIELRYNRGHPKEWNRPAWSILSEARKLISDLQSALGGIELFGRCIISRMQPGEVIQSHIHEVQFGAPPIFDTFQIPLQVDEGWIFECGGEKLWMQPGTAWTFPNQVLHSVYSVTTDPPPRPRISLMADIRPFV